MKLTRKIHELEAFEWTGDNDAELTAWLATLDSPFGECTCVDGVASVKTPADEIKVPAPAIFTYQPSNKQLGVITKEECESSFEVV